MEIVTIIGNGNTTDLSVSGQDRLGPLDGVPWGVAFDFQEQLYFSVLDQGYFG